MEQQEVFSYSAFISYSHKDLRLARKVHRFLTGFHIPRKARKKLHLKSSRLGPIFRDETNMRATKLSEAIKEGLAASKYLLVLSTPNAVADNEDGFNWVNEEIKTFVSVSSRGEEHLVPVVYCPDEGTHIKKCLPSALLPYNPYYLEIAKFGFRGAMVRVAASLLGVKPDVFWDWYAKELLIKRLMLLLALLILSAAIAFGVWWYETPHDRCYADYVECNNIPMGLRELSDEEVASAYQHYCFTTRRNRLVRVRRCTSSGLVTSDQLPLSEERPCEMSLDYSSETGKVERQTYYDENGKIVQIREFPDNATVIFLTPSTPDSLGQMAMGMNYEEQDGIGHMVERMRVERENGYIMRESYTDARGDAQPNEDGVFGVRYVRDAQGRITSKKSLSEKGELRSDAQGVAETRFSYNQLGQLNLVSYLGENEAPVWTEKGACSAFVEWKGETPVSVSFRDEKKKPCLNGIGAASYSWQYEKGKRTRSICRDEQGNICFAFDGVAVTEMIYNGKGQMVAKIHRAPDDKLCYDVDGVASYYYAYDENNHCILRASYDKAGKLVCSKNGYAIWKAVSPQELNTAEKESGHADVSYSGVLHYDERQQPAYPKGGTPMILYENDTRGRLVHVEFLDSNGKMMKNSDGVAACDFEYDKYNHKTRILYYNENNDLLPTHYDPWAGRFDVADVRITWNDLGLPASIATYTEISKPYNHYYGENAVQERTRYSKNVLYAHDDGTEAYYDLVETSYYDGVEDGAKLVNAWSGSAIQKQYYDARGDAVICEWYGSDRKPMISTEDGVFRVMREYDSRHHRVTERYYDTEGKPCTGKEGAHQIKWTYDSRGYQTEVRFYDEYGELCMNEIGGFAVGYSEYDYAGRILEERLYDTKMNLCHGSDGWAICKRQYGPQGNKRLESYWADEKTPVSSLLHRCHLIKWKHNSRGSVTESELYGVDGKLLNDPSVPPIRRCVLDSQDREIEISYYDCHQKPTLLPLGYFRMQQEFDNKGNIVEQKRYGVDGKLVFCLSEKLHQNPEYEELFTLMSNSFPDKSEKEIIGMLRVCVRQMISEQDESGTEKRNEGAERE